MSLFQFDFDLTFAAVFMNADRTVYARYGTRTSMESADQDVSADGLAATMSAVLELHHNYPTNKTTLSGKQPRAVQNTTPESYAALSHYKPDLDYSGEVAKSCIHCHQVRDAMRVARREKGQSLSDQLLFPFPAPDSIGLKLDLSSASTVSSVATGSISDFAGVRAGDRLELVDGQPIVSPADLQWVLHHKGDKDRLDVSVLRDEQRVQRTIELPEGWRENQDISWRPTTWDLRRMATGGLVLKVLGEAGRAEMGIPNGIMALRVDHVGQYGEHATAKRAGIRKNDVLISFDGRSDLRTESQLIRYALNEKKTGDLAVVEYLRDSRPHKTEFRLR